MRCKVEIYERTSGLLFFCLLLPSINERYTEIHRVRVRFIPVCIRSVNPAVVELITEKKR